MSCGAPRRRLSEWDVREAYGFREAPARTFVGYLFLAFTCVRLVGLITSLSYSRWTEVGLLTLFTFASCGGTRISCGAADRGIAQTLQDHPLGKPSASPASLQE